MPNQAICCWEIKKGLSLSNQYYKCITAMKFSQTSFPVQLEGVCVDVLRIIHLPALHYRIAYRITL